MCGVFQVSFSWPLKLDAYLLLQRIILKYHNIGYHVYADDTQYII